MAKTRRPRHADAEAPLTGDAALLKQARDRFQLAYDADKNQREREREALRMFALDQWPDAVRQSRSAQAATGILPATPARPMLVVDRLREPVNQVVNQERESDLSVELVEAGDFGGVMGQPNPVNAAEIELREGLIRRLQRDTHAASARSWAFLRAVVCGRGHYAINIRYVDGKTFDQELYYRRIYDQSGVMLDPAHEEPDGSDAEWGFIYTLMSREQYEAEFPRAKDGPNPNVGCSDSDWFALDQLAPGWFTDEGGVRYVRIAEYWYTEHTSRTLYQMPDGTAVWKDDAPKGVKPIAERDVVQKSVKCCKLDGCQVLDEIDWPSPYIPIVKIVGNEIPPCDQERRVDGMVNKSAIESQRGINYMASKVTEEVGLSAVAPLMATAGQIEGYEPFYSQAATRAFPYLPYNYRDAEGNIAPPPFRPDKNPQIAAVSGALQMFVQAVQTSTGVPDPNMGRADKNSPTWRGTQALLAQGQRGASNYMDNLKRSVEYDGRIVNSLLYPVYNNRPGRLVQIVTGDSTTKPETVAIGAPFVMQDDGQGGKMPIPAPAGMTAQRDNGVRHYTLTKDANFNVAVKVSKGFDTRRDEEAAMFGELLTQNPELMTWFGDLFFGSQDWPGAKDAAERAQVMLAPPIQQQIEQKKGGQPAIPPMVQQQMQQQGQQIQQMGQMLQQAQQELQTRFTETQMKAQAEKEIAQIKAQAEIELENIKQLAAIRIAELKAGTELQKSREEVDAENAQRHLDRVHELTTAQMAAESARASMEAAEPESSEV